MDNSQSADKLVELAQLDIDAIKCYDQALKNIDLPAVYDQLSEFKKDHERHVRDLSGEIRRLGSEPPKFSPDIKGFFLSGFTAIRSMTGTEGALKAMRSNEKLTNKTYQEALSWSFSQDLKSLIEGNYADEQRHLRYIEQILQAQPWASAAAPQP